MTDSTSLGGRPSAAQRLAAALGRPDPRPLTDDEVRRLEAAQDRADEEALRIYGLHDQAA